MKNIYLRARTAKRMAAMLLSALLFTTALFGQSTGDLLFTEIMFDPPQVGPLAGIKYVEIYNDSDRPIALDDYHFLYRKTLYTMPKYTLKAHKYAVMLAKENNVDASIQIHMPEFPALSSGSTLALLKGEELESVDEVTISRDLYGVGYTHGGASVERVTYTGTNDRWRRCLASKGGTPGKPFVESNNQEVPLGSVVINEVMITTKGVQEKFFELFNPSDVPVRLSDIYLEYRKLPDERWKAWRLTKEDDMLLPGGFMVFTQYADGLIRQHAIKDPSMVKERIDYPIFSATYTEIRLCSFEDNSVLDQMTFRRQFLGDQMKDRSGYSLERKNVRRPGNDPTNWGRCLDDEHGGTPGRLNTQAGGNGGKVTISGEWPEDPELSRDEMLLFAERYPDRTTLRIYNMLGQTLFKCRGSGVKNFVDTYIRGESPWPLQVIVVCVDIEGDEDKEDLYYRSKWLSHTF